MELLIRNEEKIVFEGSAEFIAAPTPDGEIGILAGHARMISSLEPGILRIHQGEKKENVEIHGGFIEIAGDTVRVYTPSIERKK